MSKKVTIFVEGKNDIVFLRQLIRKLYNGLELGEDGTIGGIIEMGGHDREHIFKSKFYQSTAKQYHNIVFEDADLKKDNRGLQNVQQLLEKRKLNYQLEFDYFIFPTNQAEEGSLENILLNTVQQPKKEWINCAINYYECLGKNGFDIPDSHGRWNYMTGHLLDDKKLNFSDKTTWFIEGNSYLKPLIDFLNKFFK